MEKIGKPQNNYWENFYKNNSLTKKPSDFCKYVCETFDLRELTVLDLCSGNGRDSYYLASQSKKVVAVDQAVKIKNLYNLVCFKEKISNFFLNNKDDDFDLTYCRFGIHSIEEEEEDIILQNSRFIAFEFRSDKDDSYKQDHYRRKINGNKFLTKIIHFGFEVCYYKEAKNLAVFKEQDPYIIRIIAKKR